MTTGRLRIRHIDPKALTPAPYNPNVQTAAEFEQLLRSLEYFGFVEPILVNSRTGWIVGGHHRRDAAIELGLDKVPVVERDLSPEDEKALNIALNNRNLQGQFEPEKLVAVLDEFADTPMLERTGFSFDQYQALQLDLAEPSKLGRVGTVHDPSDKPKSKVGQTWALGDRHVLRVGDCLDPDSYDDGTDPEGGITAMCFTDPPFNVDYEGGTDEHLTMLNDRWPDEATYSAWLTEALTQIRQHTAGAIYCCFGDRHAPALLAAADKAGIHHSSTIVWVKDRLVLGRGDYHWQWEPIFYGWTRGDPHYFIDDRTQTNVWDHAIPKRGDRGRKGRSNVWRYNRSAASRLHPTMKPVALVEHAIRNSSLPGEVVLDAFGGSGSTMVAAENTGRRSYTIELDPAYADVIIARYESLETGDPVRKTGGPK